MSRLTVISGPECSGKLPLAKVLVTDNARLLVHRDTIRSALVNPIPEADLTWLMYDVAHSLITRGYDVVVVAQNLDPWDRTLWAALACETGVDMNWLDTRDEEAHRLIPPLEGWQPARW